MKKLLQNKRLLIIFILALVYLGVFLLMIPFFFFELMEVPLGWLLGGAFGLGAVLTFTSTLKPNEPLKAWKMILFSFLRILLFAIPLIGGALLYYKLDIEYFNIISIAAGLAVPLILFAILTATLKQKPEVETEGSKEIVEGEVESVVEGEIINE